MRICEAKDCNTPVFGTCKKSRKGYCKRHQSLREDFDGRSLTQKAISKINKNKTNSLSRKITQVAKSNEAFRNGGKSKSELLKEADRLFSLFIRNRDADKNGNVACVCCGKIYNLEDKDNNGDKIVQCLHFVKREVYSYRFDEEQCAAGCTWCNKDMHDNPKGMAYSQFKERLIADVGAEYVAEMELAHRKINRIEESQLKVVIELYSNG